MLKETTTYKCILKFWKKPTWAEAHHYFVLDTPHEPKSFLLSSLAKNLGIFRKRLKVGLAQQSWSQEELQS